VRNYALHLQRKIEDLERFNNDLGDRLQRSVQENAKLYNDFKLCERRCNELELKTREIAMENITLKAENLTLKNLTAEHTNLLAELDRERKRIKRLEKLLNRRSGKEGYFGLATPSALKINKESATPEKKNRRGGARKGHTGYGRRGFTKSEADELVKLDKTPPPCTCGGDWRKGDLKEHCVVEYIRSRKVKRFILKRECTCTKCGIRVEPHTPGVISGGLYGNSMVAHLMAEYYLHGLTAGNICRREEINEGTFFNISHRCAALLKSTADKIFKELRTCFVLHADETGWRNDGAKAYAWLFANSEISAFLFRKTRASIVPDELFGNSRLDLNLITDRYKGYNHLPVMRQYCYVHLLRDLETLEMDFPDEPEVQCFTSEIKPYIKQAIGLHKQNLELAEYIVAALELKKSIMEICGRQANHPGIQNFQNIFREHPDKLFQWTKSPEIPADNNFAERSLRPTVIARKISFGSQSDRGMQTREVLMTFLYTARSRGLDPEKTLEEALNILSENPDTDIYQLLLKPNVDTCTHRVA